MRFFRSRKRLATRNSFPRQTWDMNRKRSKLLKIKQLFQGKFLIILLIAISSIGLIYGAFFTPFMSVQSVEVNTDNRDINVDRLSKSLNDSLVGKNELLLSVDNLEKSAYDQFPDISSLSCGRNFFARTVSCNALGYELVAVINHDGSKYYINENGVVIGYDGRKLGLPIFDLILNPVFAEIADKGKSAPTPETPDTAVAPPATDSPPVPSPVPPPTPSPSPPPVPVPVPVPVPTLNFTTPTQDPPVVPLVMRQDDNVFEVTVGKKILEAKELQSILEAIKSLEQIMGRRVIHAQYVQVAGELSMTSKPAPNTPVKDQNAPQDPKKTDTPVDPKTPKVPTPVESPDHEFTVLLDLRRNLDVQFKKLVKTKEVIDFSQVTQIDLSIDGEKVFYR